MKGQQFPNSPKKRKNNYHQMILSVKASRELGAARNHNWSPLFFCALQMTVHEMCWSYVTCSKKSKTFEELLGVKDFTSSNVWLDRLKKRHGITL